MKKFILLIILAPSVLMFPACTYNPFYSEDAAKDYQLVRGKVQLQDGDSPDNVYVWLEQLNLSTRTNSQGEFSLGIPRTDALSGYNNDLRLYYYIGNYEIQYSNVLVVDGSFEYGKYDINSDGRIRDTIYLRKLIDIRTISIPQNINENYSGSMNIEVVVTNLDTNLQVTNQMTRDRTLSGIIFREVNSPYEDATRFVLSGAVYFGHRLFDPVTWQTSFNYPFKLLPPGTYEVYPFIFLRQPEIPADLLESFGANANRFTDAYLKIPYKHRFGRLTIN
jgi:hypothetical protein